MRSATRKYGRSRTRYALLAPNSIPSSATSAFIGFPRRKLCTLSRKLDERLDDEYDPVKTCSMMALELEGIRINGDN